VLSTVGGHVKANEAVLYGTEGTLHVSDGVLSGARREDRRLSEIPILPKNEGQWRVEEEFIAAIRGTETITHTTFEDGLKYMEFTEAVARSLVNKKTESLPRS